MHMEWHHLMFDEKEQIGAGEYTRLPSSSASMLPASATLERMSMHSWKLLSSEFMQRTRRA